MYDSCCVHSGTLARIFFARCSALQEVFFCCPKQLFFNLCATKSGLHWYVMTLQSLRHVYMWCAQMFLHVWGECWSVDMYAVYVCLSICSSTQFGPLNLLSSTSRHVSCIGVSESCCHTCVFVSVCQCLLVFVRLDVSKVNLLLPGLLLDHLCVWVCVCECVIAVVCCHCTHSKK